MLNKIVRAKAARAVQVGAQVDHHGCAPVSPSLTRCSCSHSAGVARQHNGRHGKEDNCQVGVFLIG